MNSLWVILFLIFAFIGSFAGCFAGFYVFCRIKTVETPQVDPVARLKKAPRVDVNAMMAVQTPEFRAEKQYFEEIRRKREQMKRKP